MVFSAILFNILNSCFKIIDVFYPNSRAFHGLNKFCRENMYTRNVKIYIDISENEQYSRKKKLRTYTEE